MAPSLGQQCLDIFTFVAGLWPQRIKDFVGIMKSGSLRLPWRVERLSREDDGQHERSGLAPSLEDQWLDIFHVGAGL